MNSKVLIVYASQYGQTQKISQYIGQQLERRNIPTEIYAIDSALLPDTLASYKAIIIGSPIYLGQPDRNLVRWAFRHRQEIAEQETKALFLVDLNAADPRPEAIETENKLMATFQKLTGCQPDLTAHFIGAIKFRDYSFWIRWILKRISKKAGGPVDTSRNHELTRWEDVEHFADQVALRLGVLVPQTDKMSHRITPEYV